MATEQYSIGYEEGFQNGWNAAVDAKPEQPAQQEPMAFIEATADNDSAYAYADGWNACAKAHKFTSPPAQRTWVGLTDEELSEVYNKADWDTVNGWEYERAVEAKLKSKNENRN